MIRGGRARPSARWQYQAVTRPAGAPDKSDRRDKPPAGGPFFASRSEPVDLPPPLRGHPQVPEAVVQAALAALPELEPLGADHAPAPVRRPRHRPALEPGLGLGVPR